MTWSKAFVGAGALAASLFIAPTEAEAACSPLSLCACTVTATPVSFGNYDPISRTNTDVAGEVRVRCTLALSLTGSFDVSLSTGGSGTFGSRVLKNGASELRYNLYTTAARTQVWGDGTGGSARVSHSFAGLLVVERNIPVYGRIAAGQNVPSGTYRDTITVTVFY